jgi:hypothetical protein
MNEPKPSNQIPELKEVNDLVAQASGNYQAVWEMPWGSVFLQVTPEGRCLVNGDYVEPAEGKAHLHKPMSKRGA